MLNKVDYEHLRILFNTNEDTFDIYKLLTCTIDKNSKDLLYIYKTKEEADFEYKKIVEKFKYCINKKDKQNRTIELKSKDKIYIWTINRIKRQIYGYKFRDIRIR